jgi:hypothetical protein
VTPRRRALVGGAVVYLVGSIAGGLLLDSPSSGAFDLVLRWLALPFAALAVVVARASRAPGARSRATVLTAVAVFAVLTLGAIGWVALANALGAEGEVVTVAGPILEKSSTSGRSTSYSVRIRDERTGRRVRLSVSAPEYRAAAVGERFTRSFYLGRLGVPFRWTHGAPPPAS